MDEINFTKLSKVDSHQEVVTGERAGQVVKDTKSQGGQVVSMQQTSSDCSEHLVNGAVVEMTLERPTQFSISSKYQNYDEGVTSSPMYTPPNSPSLVSPSKRTLL